MNPHFQKILDFLQKAEHLTAEEKATILKSIKDADSELATSEFNLGSAEKEKRTDAILLEATLQELEQKRKAIEVQNRELAIEAALEKVRARTMAMQRSDELAEASFILDSQVRALGIKTRGCAFNIYGENESTEWFSSEMGTMPTYKTPRENIFLTYYEAGQTGMAMYTDSFAGEACAAHYDYLCTLPVMGDSLKKLKESSGSFPTQQVDHVIYFKYGYLLFITLEPVPEAHDVFKRFAKVFEQTYTRFLDLQKAEAQAREAEIELALERVRARTMAMQHSEDLQDAASLLFKQAEALGITTWSCRYNIWEKDEKICTAWMSNKGQLQPPLKIPLTQDPTFIGFYESRQKGEDFYVEEKGGAELEALYKYMQSLSGIDKIVDRNLQNGLTLPKFQISYVANFSHGNLLFITYEPFPAAHDIFKRFAKVFEQTYTRFLDLQKAETQAREAQIELGLERVRARAMAMQKSDDLAKAVAIIFEELDKLNIGILRCGIGIINKENRSVNVWATSKSD